jgi:hypothetical protein
MAAASEPLDSTAEPPAVDAPAPPTIIDPLPAHAAATHPVAARAKAGSKRVRPEETAQAPTPPPPTALVTEQPAAPEQASPAAAKPKDFSVLSERPLLDVFPEP